MTGNLIMPWYPPQKKPKEIFRNKFKLCILVPNAAETPMLDDGSKHHSNYKHKMTDKMAQND